MNEITSEQLERFAKLYERCQELNPVFTLARQGLQLREARNGHTFESLQKMWEDTHIELAEVISQRDTLTAELEAAKLQTLMDSECIERIQQHGYKNEVEIEALRKDKERSKRELGEVEELLEKLSKLGNEPLLGNSDGNVIAQKALAILKRLTETL